MSTPNDEESRAQPADVVPVCPRHRDRESYVRCQRCERPVCPECQRPAAVGVQCVDCVRAQAKTIRTANTVFGGRAVDGRPVVTLSLIVLCSLGYLAEITVGERVVDDFAFYPPAALQEPWRFITSAFLHEPGLPLHLLFNMYALWLIGPQLESLLGRARYLGLYLISAIGGSVGYFVIVPASAGSNSDWDASEFGASGAIFGLFAALVVVNRRLGRSNTGIIGWIAVIGVLGFLPGWQIAWQAHLGGLLTGALISTLLVAAPKQRRGLLQLGGFVAVSVVLLALVAIKVALVPEGLLL